MRHWESLHSDEGAVFDKEVRLDASQLPPLVTWGTSPQDVATITGTVPSLEAGLSETKKASIARPKLHGAEGRRENQDINIDRVFIGSCTTWQDRGSARRRQDGRG